MSVLTLSVLLVGGVVVGLIDRREEPVALPIVYPTKASCSRRLSIVSIDDVTVQNDGIVAAGVLLNRVDDFADYVSFSDCRTSSRTPIAMPPNGPRADSQVAYHAAAG